MIPAFLQLQSLTAFQYGQLLLGLAILSLSLKALYTLFLHPLAKYPGPKLWAFSALVNTFYGLRGKKVYLISQLHNIYGPIVRVGPNELSYISEVAEKDIYSSHRASGGQQLGRYKFTAEARIGGLFNNSNDADHGRIRKIVGAGFSEKGIREREPFLQYSIDILIQKLRERPAEKGVDLAWWLDCIGFDTVAHIAFGKSFRALETTTRPELVAHAHGIIVRSNNNAVIGQFFLGRLWLGLFKDNDNNRFVRKVVKENAAGNQARRNGEKKSKFEDVDLISLMSIKTDSPKGISQAEVAITCADFLIAGGGTAASAISAAIYHLLMNPAKLQSLTNEIRKAFEIEEDIKMANVAKLRYLTAVINESLRLSPAVPESTRRITGPNGNTICGEHIPAGIRVGVYRYAAGHYAAAFKDVESFVPERWLGDKEYESDQLGIVAPFAIGPRNCIGQSFAMAYMRLILARLFWNFDLELCEESRNWIDHKAYALLLDKGPLLVKLRSRM